MALAPNTPEPEVEAEVAAVSLPIGWNVLYNDTLLGTYPTEAEANDYADGHPRADGLTVEVVETQA